MLEALYSHPRIGLVGPCSNHVSGPQQVTVAYEELEGLDGFAWDWGKAHNHIRADTDRLVGFCLLIRRAVVDKIGLLDEQFSPGNFEDDDYCIRAMEAGFRVIIARDSFVHHFGERTFAASDIRFGELLARNQRLLREKLRAKYSSERASDEIPAAAAKVGSATNPPGLSRFIPVVRASTYAGSSLSPATLLPTAASGGDGQQRHAEGGPFSPSS